MEDKHPVCRLAHGQLYEWRGLQPFSAVTWPACLESTGEKGWLRFHYEPLAYQVFRLRQSPAQIWLFSPGEADVCLVEVFGLSEEPDIDRLGAPDLCFDYPLEARLQRSLGNPDEYQQECVYAGRGLALLFGLPLGQAQHLLRVRGFKPMSADSYRDRFVDLPPVRWFGLSM